MKVIDVSTKNMSRENHKRIIIWSIVIVIVVFIVYWLSVSAAFIEIEKTALFGDTFGALTCFFSALSFLGVLYVIWIDSKERMLRSKIDVYESILTTLKYQYDAIEEDDSEKQRIASRIVRFSKNLEEMIVNQHGINDSAIINAFKQIKFFTDKEIIQNLKEIKKYLTQVDIFDEDSLNKLVKNKEIIDKIKEIYIRDLKRNVENPFDPIALALWGGIMFKYGINFETEYFINLQIKKSPEYKSKNPITT